MYFDAYYSDPHYFHHNIIKYCNRPFVDSYEMNEKLIQNYNSIVRNNDVVLWLGDCFFTKKQELKKEIIGRLNGRKFLLRGNHDDRTSDVMFYDMGFSGIFSTHFFGEIGRYPVRYSHYPCFGLTKDERYVDRRPPIEIGVTVIHGHTHQKEKITGKDHIHAGVDAWGYGPAHYDEVLQLLQDIEYEKE